MFCSLLIYKGEGKLLPRLGSNWQREQIGKRHSDIYLCIKTEWDTSSGSLVCLPVTYGKEKCDVTVQDEKVAVNATLSNCSSRWSMLESVIRFLPYFPYVNNQYFCRHAPASTKLRIDAQIVPDEQFNLTLVHLCQVWRTAALSLQHMPDSSWKKKSYFKCPTTASLQPLCHFRAL